MQSYFPYLPESERENSYHLQDLKDQTEKIQHKFEKLVFDLQKEYERSATPDLDVITRLHYNSNLEIILRGCSDLTEAFIAVKKNVSFFDYRLVKTLIAETESTSMKKKLKKYQKSFQKYVKRRVCECPCNAFGDVKESEKVYAIKIERDIEAMTLNEVNKFTHETNKILGHKLLRLLNIKDGCMELVYRTFENEEFSITEKQQLALRRLGVLHISYGDNIESVSIPVEEVQSDIFSGKDCTKMHNHFSH